MPSYGTEKISIIPAAYDELFEFGTSFLQVLLQINLYIPSNRKRSALTVGLSQPDTLKSMLKRQR